MAIDYDRLRFGKGKPFRLQLDEAKAEWKKVDERESKWIRKKRSGGRCEVSIDGVRCRRRAYEIHHHMGGYGVRGRGASALAQNKTHACSQCHRRITAKVLQHISGNRYRERT